VKNPYKLMTYSDNYGTCNISCNWPKIVNYNFSITFVDFTLGTVILHANSYKVGLALELDFATSQDRRW